MIRQPAPVGEQPTPSIKPPVQTPWAGTRIVVSWYPKHAVVIRTRWGSVKATPGVVSAASGTNWWDVRYMEPADRSQAAWWESWIDGRWRRIIDPRLAR